MKPMLAVSVAAVAVIGLAGCTVAPPSAPTVVAMPGPGVTFNTFQQDDNYCRYYASQRSQAGGSGGGVDRVGDGYAQIHLADGGIALDVVQGAKQIGDQGHVARRRPESGDVALDIRHLIGQVVDEFLQRFTVGDTGLEQGGAVHGVCFRKGDCSNIRQT